MTTPTPDHPRRLTTQDEVEALIAQAGPAWLLKHSLTCGISAAAHDEFTAHLAAHPDQPAGVVAVQTSRALCAWIATRLGYAHQSPQLFLLLRGGATWQASHYAITAGAMMAAWKKNG